MTFPEKYPSVGRFVQCGTPRNFLTFLSVCTIITLLFKLQFFPRNRATGKKEPIMYQPRILTIQDISCFGKCSLTVALPIISAMGVEACIMPTAVLSTHTGGFTGYTWRDLTGDMRGIKEHWISLGLKFDSIYTGYLGSSEQIRIVGEIFDTLGDGAVKLIDPVMGDNGKLYTGFTEEFAAGMAKLCGKADIIVPNLTEAAFMLGIPFPTAPHNEPEIKDILVKLTELGCRTAVLTGIIPDSSHQGVMAYDSASGKFYSYYSKNINVKFHGTGDIFASTLCGAIAKKQTLPDTLKTAVDYTVACIERSIGDDEHTYGVRFEECLSMLTDKQ